MFSTSLMAGLLFSASIVGSSPLQNMQINISAVPLAKIINDLKQSVPKVPFYSQFSDIKSEKWQKVGCGIASLAMLIDFYHPEILAMGVDSLLMEGIAAGAYAEPDGWEHDGLISLAEKYDLKGVRHNFSGLSSEDSFNQLKKILKDGPVMASVHYNFDPKNPIPHLVVITGIASTTVYYNDPAEKSGSGEISKQKFIKAWKKRLIAIRA